MGQPVDSWGYEDAYDSGQTAHIGRERVEGKRDGGIPYLRDP